MHIVDILDRPLWNKHVPAPQKKSEELVAGFISDPACLEIIVEELSTLCSDEVSRFDGWTNKGAAMLGASGLILSLMPLGFPLVEVKNDFQTFTQLWVWFIQESLFILAVMGYFLATWNSLVSLRRRPICRLNEDDWHNKKHTNLDVFHKSLAAEKMAIYKNNVDIVDLKATKVNEAWKYFFLACLSQMVFWGVSVFRYLYFNQ